MENKDIRWIQRFDNYTKALYQLKKTGIASTFNAKPS
jgi:hypothetical protein